MNVDVIIVGFGLAGLSMAASLEASGHSFIIIDDPKGGSSKRAAGIYNPTILKRYTMAWQGPELLDNALSFYRQLEYKLGDTFLYPLPIARIFSSVSEQNQWMVASDKKQFSPFLTPTIHTKAPETIRAPFGYGHVTGVGRLAIPKLLSTFRNKCLTSEQYLAVPFDYSELQNQNDRVQYQSIEAKHIIFCEGAKARHNPYFSWLPLRGAHGDMLQIEASELDPDRIWKSRLFVVPQGDNIYWVGASFNNNFKEPLPTHEGRKWLLEHLDKLIDTPYKIIEHQGCVRPTVVDRRPLVGTHPEHSNIHILNGLGSRGVLTAPQMGVHLRDAIFNDVALPEVISISRFF